ncbi:host cell division inhibitor Icd-like protein [Pectobacterium versatile]|uniref:host cell division inhibitor Icd-like protein n=2 Tax=Pectobacteriaceae TaxID=1903410 RepID=UPI0031F56082
MLNKTKAAMPGRPCHCTKLKHIQDNTLIDQVNGRNDHSVPAQFCALLVNQASEFSRDQKFFDFSKPWQEYIWFRIVFISEFTVLDIPIVIGRNEDLITYWIGVTCLICVDYEGREFDIHLVDSLFSGKAILRHYSVSPLAGCLLCLRWRRLISPLAAAMRKPAVLSSDSLTLSINSKSSSGSLTETCSDLLFLLPVAITESPYIWWCSVCLIKNSNQVLTWCSPVNILVVFTLLELVSKTTKPGSALTLTGPLTTNVMETNAMAMPKCTQTHPKFTWRFLALNRHDKKAKPCRLSVEAATEREARLILAPHFILSFAARLPLVDMVEIVMPTCVVETETQEVRHV